MFEHRLNLYREKLYYRCVSESVNLFWIFSFTFSCEQIMGFHSIVFYVYMIFKVGRARQFTLGKNARVCKCFWVDWINDHANERHRFNDQFVSGKSQTDADEFSEWVGVSKQCVSWKHSVHKLIRFSCLVHEVMRTFHVFTVGRIFITEWEVFCYSKNLANRLAMLCVTTMFLACSAKRWRHDLARITTASE